ncbi:MAG: ATP-binding cassette domain-containing protein, partial [Mycobacteriaceae bacterium]
MLEVQDLVTRYGPVTALDRVGFTLETSTITAVLGANGAGKTSLLRTISGLVRPESGHVLFNGDAPRCQRSAGADKGRRPMAVQAGTSR